MMHDFSKPQPHVASQRNCKEKETTRLYVDHCGDFPNCTSCLYGRGSFSESTAGNTVSYAVGTFLDA